MGLTTGQDSSIGDLFDLVAGPLASTSDRLDELIVAIISLCAPDLITFGETPTRLYRALKSLPFIITPIEPVTVPGLASISLAAIDTYTPPDAAISPIEATTGIDF